MSQVLGRYGTGLPRRVLKAWSQHGWKGLWARAIDAFGHHRPIDQFYAEWIELYARSIARTSEGMRQEIAAWRAPPRISLLIAVRDGDSARLAAAVQAVRAQLYPHWELCIGPDATESARVREALASLLSSLAQADDRVRVAVDTAGGGICGGLNSALALATGEFIALLDCSDRLSEHALYWAAKELLEAPQADLVFSDEDLIDATGKRSTPRFKPDWNLALMLSCNGFGRLGVFRRSLVEVVGGFRPEFSGSLEYDLVLRCAQATRPERIRHIPRVLYHRRAPVMDHASPLPTPPPQERREPTEFGAPMGLKPPEGTPDATGDAEAAWEAGRSAIEQHLAWSGVGATVGRGSAGGYQVDYALPSPPPQVSILLPSTCEARLIEPCLVSLLTRSRYPDFEVLLLVNERHRQDPAKAALLARFAETPRLRVLAYPDRPFNYSWINNWGAGQAKGELICFLNDDTTVITPDWLARLAARACQPGVAAAGPLLRYPDDSIQHAGVILGLGGVAGHAAHGLPKGDCGYLERACLEQDVSCLTAACLVMRAEVFRKVGGFDEELPITFNDVDLCLRVRAAGWRLIFTPTAELHHNESASIGEPSSRQRVDELREAAAVMRERWGPVLDSDPYYNSNLSLRRAFHLAFPPRHPASRPIRGGES